MAGEVRIFMDINGQRQREISPFALRTLHKKMNTVMAREMGRVGELLLNEIIWGYTKAIRVDREIKPGRKSRPLRQKLKAALTMKVGGSRNELWLGVFDLARMDAETRNQGKGTDNIGWFLFFEDGHEGNGHKSRNWQFVSLERALRHAERAAEMLKLSKRDKQSFITDVKRHFKGRLGEGIMVRLDGPLFLRYPQYGMGEDGKSRAGNVLGWRGHKGFKAWNVLQQVGGPFSTVGSKYINPDRDYFLVDMVKRVVNDVMEEL